MTELSLTERQQKTVAFAVTLVCAVIIFCFVGGLFWFLGWLIHRFSAILLPLAVAGVLALILKPFHLWWQRRLGDRPVAAVFAVFLSALIPLSVVTFALGVKVMTETSEALRLMPKRMEAFEANLQEKWPAIETFWREHQLTEKLKAGMQRHGAAIFQSATKMTEFAIQAWSNIFRAVVGMFGWAILPVYLGFFLLGKSIDKGKFEDLFPFLREGTRQDLSSLVFEFIDILVAFFRGQILIALIQGILFAVGFSIVRLEYGFTLGLALGLLNVIPYLGSIVGLGIALPVAFFQDEGGLLLVILVLIVFGVVQAIEGYLLTPKIMGDRTGLHPLAIIVAIFFWGSVFGGITGMILAIPLTAFLVVLWRLAKAKYIREVL